ncbi:MAG: type IV pilus biogenesis/stability protein PilW [Proteobacteria bacterium]|nr:type IV pilus biogenesis/stability protein PilW [Pseudomonadota bacterium]
MRLRDVGLLTATFLALALLAGCHRAKNQNPYFYSTQQDVPKFKSNADTPHAIAQNEIALAQEYIKMGKYDVALTRLQNAVKVEPNSPDGYTVLGLLYERINRPELAEANYAKAVKLAPDKGDMLNNYGAWLCRSGHPAQADAQFRKALADPFYQTPTLAMGNAAMCALKAGNTALAEGYARQTLALQSNNIDAMQMLADLAYQRGDYMNARAFVERYLATGQYSPAVLELGAKIEEKLGDPAAARSYRARIASDAPPPAPSQN